MSAFLLQRESRLGPRFAVQADAGSFEQHEQDSRPALAPLHERTVLLEAGLEFPGIVPAPVRAPRRRVWATLVDVGQEGIGVRVSPHAASQLLACVWFRCEFRDSASPQPIRLAARVTHGRPTLDGSYYVGLAFECTKEREQRSPASRSAEIRADLPARCSQQEC
jgi:hypothetical protein